MELWMKDRNVWSKSEKLKKHPTLLEYALTGNETCLTQDDKVILGTKVLKEELSMAIKAEWEWDSSKGVNPVEFDRKNRQVCDRCGNKTLIHVCYIRNKKNGAKMQVGYECISEILIGDEKKKIVNMRQFKSDKRRISLEKIQPGILEYIKALGTFISDSKIVIPTKLKEKYINNSNSFGGKYQLYISTEKTPDKNAEQVQQEVIELYHENMNIETEIEKYKNEAEGNPFAAYKSFLKDLPLAVRNEVEESGIIGKQAIYQLKNSVFNQRIQSVISETVKKYEVFIVSSSVGGFVYSVPKRMEAFIISLQNLVELVCEEIYEEASKSNCNKEDFLLSSNFCDSEDKTIAIEKLLSSLGYSCSVNGEFDELIVYRSDIFDRIEIGTLSRKQNNAKLFNLTKFTNRFKNNLLLGTKAEQSDILNYINTGESINIKNYERNRHGFNNYG